MAGVGVGEGEGGVIDNCIVVASEVKTVLFFIYFFVFATTNYVCLQWMSKEDPILLVCEIHAPLCLANV